MKYETAQEFCTEFLIKECHYLAARDLGDGRYAAVAPLMSTVAIVVGDIGDEMGYSDRWCYHDAKTALVAMTVWNGTGDPASWHRHPKSGRRVAENDSTYDEDGKLVPKGEMYVRP